MGGMPGKKIGSGEWRTPPYIVALAKELFGLSRFDIDGAASAENRVASKWLGDAFSDSPDVGSVVWLNPPWANLHRWCYRALEWARDRKCTVVLLLPASTDTRWFDLIWNDLYTHSIVFLSPRVPFVDPQGKGRRSPPVGSMFVLLKGRRRSSIDPTVMLVNWKAAYAGVSELEDERDLGSRAARRGGSTPPSRTSIDERGVGNEVGNEQ